MSVRNFLLASCTFSLGLVACSGDKAPQHGGGSDKDSGASNADQDGSASGSGGSSGSPGSAGGRGAGGAGNGGDDRDGSVAEGGTSAGGTSAGGTHAGTGGAATGGAGGDDATLLGFSAEWIARTSEGHLALVGTSSDGQLGAQIASDGSLLWKQPVLKGMSTSGFPFRISGIVADSKGGFSVGGLTLVALPGETQHGMNDHFFARFDASGKSVWGHQVGTVSPYAPWGMKMDSADNLYTGGGAIDYGDSLDVKEPVVLTKWSPTGETIWTAPLVGQSQDSSTLTHWVEYETLDVDSAGNAYVLALWKVFDAGKLGDKGTVYLEVQKFDTDGNQMSVSRLDSGSCNLAYPFSGYRWTLSVNQDGTAFYAAGYDCLIKLNDAGKSIWTTQLDSLTQAGKRRVMFVSPDESSIYLSVEDAATLSKYTSNGKSSWSRTVGSGRFDVDVDGASIFVLGSGYVYNVATDGTGDPQLIAKPF
ncbi:MAG TPA: hypothetical protein VHC69_14315 [Polyangiaceae bacterium]|nr:hypothetical protein [Polyangiaceae bacterium]